MQLGIQLVMQLGMILGTPLRMKLIWCWKMNNIKKNSWDCLEWAISRSVFGQVHNVVAKTTWSIPQHFGKDVCGTPIRNEINQELKNE